MQDRQDNSQEPLRVRTPRGREVLGIVDAMLGSNKLRVRCQDDRIRLCRIPGKLRKKVWMHEGDVVLVEPWEIQGETNADIIMKYNPTQVSWLRKKGLLRLEV